MKKQLFKVLSAIMLLSLVIAACGGGATTAAPTAVPTKPPATTAPTQPPAAKGKICEVTDTGGVDDKSFNATAWVGAQDAAKTNGWEATYLESKQQTDYDKNITEFLKSDCNLIVTVGFLLGDATKAAADANPNQKFQILDYAYGEPHANIWQQVYATQEGAFLAGYVAASATKTGKIGTFGGINIPPVADFMVGFQEGMEYYNTQHGTKVELLGWDNAKKDGLFTGDFNDQDKGKSFGQNLIDEGADIIMPVAGPVGLGTAAAVKENPGVMLIGVDTDWFNSAPEYQDIVLTSVLKHLELSVQSAAKAVADGSFAGGVQVATLANGEIGIAPFHNFDSTISDATKTELKQVTADIISGKIAVHSFSTLGEAAPAATIKGKICEVTDTGGVDDKSFNATAWVGAQDAATTYGTEATYLESKQQTDYEKNINEFLKSDCALIVTVGFLLGDATATAATANPDQKFQILDFAYGEPHDNVWQQVYATQEGAFLAGYVAASATKTGKIGTFGGINIPPVADFMVGFQEGMEYYNTQHGTKVELLGWDNAKKDGLFTGDFNDQDKGKSFGQNLIDEGADIIMPVAGPVGLGTAAAVKENPGVMLIGVDTDWFNSAPEYQDIVLTSVLKHLELSVQSAAKAVADGSFAGGLQVATLANGEIGIAPFHNFDSTISDATKTELKQVTADIISGKITVDSFSTLK
jgi:basic membrane protein A